MYAYILVINKLNYVVVVDVDDVVDALVLVLVLG